MSGPSDVLIFGFPSGGVAPIKVLTDPNGVLLSTVVGQFGGVGAQVPSTFIVTSLDNIPAASFGIVGASFGYGFNPATGFWERLHSGANNADTIAASATGNSTTLAALIGWNGDAFDRIRIANVYKSVLATAAGNTIVWTPTAGEAFRVMGYTISVAGTMAATGVNLIKLTDGAGGTVIAQHQATVSVTTPSGDTQIGADLGQGFLSAAVNNVLNVNLGTAMATGGVAVNVWGTEE